MERKRSHDLEQFLFLIGTDINILASVLARTGPAIAKHVDLGDL